MHYIYNGKLITYEKGGATFSNPRNYASPLYPLDLLQPTPQGVGQLGGGGSEAYLTILKEICIDCFENWSFYKKNSIQIFIIYLSNRNVCFNSDRQ